MTLVAVGLVYGRRVHNYHVIAIKHADLAQSCADVAWGAERFDGPDEVSTMYWSLFQYFRDRADDYRRAAWRPWLAVESVPPPYELPDGWNL
jgi:hypothetical protein